MAAGRGAAARSTSSPPTPAPGSTSSAPDRGGCRPISRRPRADAAGARGRRGRRVPGRRPHRRHAVPGHEVRRRCARLDRRRPRLVAGQLRRHREPDAGPRPRRRRHRLAARAAGVPVVVKGVLRGDDALRCVDAGAEAVWVSNHGGRQLDRAVPTARHSARWSLRSGTGPRCTSTGASGRESMRWPDSRWVLGRCSSAAGALCPGRRRGGGGRRGCSSELTEELAEVLELAGLCDPRRGRARCWPRPASTGL